MTLDTLDQAFLHRWSTILADGEQPVCEPLHEPVGEPVREPIHERFVAAAPVAASQGEADAQQPQTLAADAVIERLLETAWSDWCAVADEVEEARRRGRRVIAITACERSAGCTTLVAGLARVLASRGRDVAVAAPDPYEGPTHGRRILLVDAGVWFPPGRINRGRLMLASAGCDAAILVRRDDRPAPPGWSVALEAIGVEPLGEVISFARGTGGADR